MTANSEAFEDVRKWWVYCSGSAWHAVPPIAYADEPYNEKRFATFALALAYVVSQMDGAK